jgi:hypothetical protein
LKTEEANTFYEKVLIKIEELRQNGNFSGLMITTKNEAHEFFIDFNLPTQKYNRLQEVE